jgi:DNA-directed RNA polymerase beta subunit
MISNFLLRLVALEVLYTLRRYTSLRILMTLQCRQAGISYAAEVQARWCWQRLNKRGEPKGGIKEVTRSMGKVPVMVGSNICNLYGLGPTDLVYVAYFSQPH